MNESQETQSEKEIETLLKVLKISGLVVGGFAAIVAGGWLGTLALKVILASPFLLQKPPRPFL